MDDESALEILKVLVKKKGALQFTTANHICGHAPNSDGCIRYAAKHSRPQFSANPFADPSHFELRPISEIVEAPRGGGYIRAYVKDGSYSEGKPADVLAKLLEPAMADKAAAS